MKGLFRRNFGHTAKTAVFATPCENIFVAMPTAIFDRIYASAGQRSERAFAAKSPPACPQADQYAHELDFFQVPI